MTALDELLPRFHFVERHGRSIASSPERAYEAAKGVTLREMPLADALFRLRSLPARLTGHEGLPRRRDEPLLPQMLAARFVLLADEPARELVVGTVGRMWTGGDRTVPIGDAAEFQAFADPGYVKVAMNFRFLEQDGGTRIETETRVLATDERSRRGFRRYWLVIRPGSGAIRRVWLRAIARRAERAAPA